MPDHQKECKSKKRSRSLERDDARSHSRKHSKKHDRHREKDHYYDRHDERRRNHSRRRSDEGDDYSTHGRKREYDQDRMESDRKKKSNGRDRREYEPELKDHNRKPDDNFKKPNQENPQKDPPGQDLPKDKLDEGIKKPVNIMTRTGGAYIPPGKLRLMQESITDKSSMAYQRIAWEALKKSIHGQINKVNTSNIGIVARLLFKENIVRGRGLLCRSIIQAQAASPTFTNVYACLVAIVNSKFPNIGELLLKRVIIQFKRAFKRGDKPVCISSTTFLAHLINQRVAHEIIGLEIMSLLVENPTDDSVEVAIAFLKECGQKLSEVTSKGCNAVFDMLRNILHEGKLDKRVQYMIEVMFQIRKDDFKDYPAVTEELDLIDEEDQFTHLVTLEDATDPQDLLNVFKMDQEYEANEDKYKELRNEILDGSDDSSEGSGEESSDDESEKEDKESDVVILDRTETNLIALRKTIYLTIQSSLDFEECAHKLLKMEIKPGQEKELCHMFLDCCAEQRTYEKFFGLLAQRFCQINKIYISPFEEIFRDTYSTVHRLDTNKLRNVAKFFAHLLFTDAISWNVLSTIKLNEEDTTSSSRIFIKILFQELSEYMGLSILNARLKDPTYAEAMEGLFPRDNPKNTRFAINFFTSIGLGGLTDELREHLKVQPKVSAIPQLIENVSSSEESDSSSESSSSSSSSSESSSSDSEEEEKQKRKTKSKSKPRHQSEKNDNHKNRKESKKKREPSSKREPPLKKEPPSKRETSPKRKSEKRKSSSKKSGKVR